MVVIQRVEPLRKINEYTVIIPHGRKDDMEQGDKVIVTLREGEEPAKIIDVGYEESVVELLNVR